MINALKYAKKLEEAGFSREQAEVQLQIITEVVEGDLATKQDLDIFRKDLEYAIQASVKDLRHDMQQLEYRLTIKLGAFLVACFTTMIILMRLWLPH